MDDPQLEQYLLNRREFLRMLSGGALGIAAGGLTLAGCSGGSGGNGLNLGNGSGGGGGNVPREVAAGNINLQEIGGTGLKVVSVYSPETPVDATGNFSTTVSGQGGQLLGVTDAAGALRALAISIPDGQGNRTRAQALSIAASSTAAAMVFITPGIIVLSPSEVRTRLEQIRTLNSFPALVTLLRQRLKTTNIGVLRNDATFNNRLAACVNEWRTRHSSAAAITRASEQEGFSCRFGAGADQAREVVLTNAAWRLVRVDRQDLDSQNRQLFLQQPVQDHMKGAVGLSVGSLFTGRLGTPFSQSQFIDLTRQPTAKLKYWVRGPGMAGGSEQLPTTITQDENNAWLHTIGFYIALPFVCLILGVSRTLTELGQALGDALTTMSQTTAFAGAAANSGIFIRRAKSGDLTVFISALLDLTIAMLAIGGTIALSFGLTGAAALAAGVVATVLGVVSVAFSASNLIVAAALLSTYRHTSSCELDVSSGQVIIR